jgi:hypothetical protein
MNGVMQDGNGNKSSKRITGISILSGAGCMSICLFIFSLFKQVGDPSTALTIIKTMLFTGSGLLGIGVVEHFSKGKK